MKKCIYFKDFSFKLQRKEMTNIHILSQLYHTVIWIIT